jgi:hypothetical protein
MFNRWIATLCALALLSSFFLLFTQPSPQPKTNRQKDPAPEILHVALPDAEKPVVLSAF